MNDEEIVNNDQALGVKSRKEGLNSHNNCVEKQGCVARPERSLKPWSHGALGGRVGVREGQELDATPSIGVQG